MKSAPLSKLEILIAKCSLTDCLGNVAICHGSDAAVPGTILALPFPVRDRTKVRIVSAARGDRVRGPKLLGIKQVTF